MWSAAPDLENPGLAALEESAKLDPERILAQGVTFSLNYHSEISRH